MKRTPERTLVRDAMTCPATSAPPDATLESVAELLGEEALGAVPIAAADGLLLGIVTEGDLLRDLGPRAPVAAAVMSAPLVAIGVDQTVDEARAVMVRHRVHHLPVLDRTGRLVGMISRDGVAAAFGEDESEIRSAVAAAVHASGGSILVLDISAGVVRLHARVADARAAHELEQRVGDLPGVRVLIPMMEYGGELSATPRME